MIKYGCIGNPLEQSLSPVIHKMLGNEAYTLCPLSKDALADFFEKREFCGINVTIPYKGDVIAYLDEVDPAAREIGAVNTVLNKNGRLIGYNTDFYGLWELISYRLHTSLTAKRVAILGSGGTAKTAVALAKKFGAREVLSVGRVSHADVISYEELYAEHRDIQILINTTPVGMYPNTDASPVDLSRFTHLECVADAVYNPINTRLVTAAKERGIPAAGGLYMLVMQAIYAHGLFFDIPAPTALGGRIFEELLRTRENIVLVGMPGCGKSTVGKILAKELGRSYFDTDEWITARAGRSVSQIFEEQGEEYFRNLEAEAVKSLSSMTGSVISTGGGAVLYHENVLVLRQNGRVYWIDRPLSELIPTADRPLAMTYEDIMALAAVRLPLYQKAADVRVTLADTPEKFAAYIRKDFEGKR